MLSVTKKSAIAWKTVNEISGRKSCNRSKLKGTTEEERLKLWQKTLPRTTRECTRKSPKMKITPILTEELNIKKGPFTMEELLKAIKSMQMGKHVILMRYQ